MTTKKSVTANKSDWIRSDQAKDCESFQLKYQAINHINLMSNVVMFLITALNIGTTSRQQNVLLTIVTKEYISTARFDQVVSKLHTKSCIVQHCNQTTNKQEAIICSSHRHTLLYLL